MKTTVAVILALLSFGAAAQVFDSGTPCYSWNGGNFSAGSFSQCNQSVIPPARPRPPAPVALPAPVAQSPILMPMSVPPAKPVIKAKPKPKVKMICRPA